MLDNVAEDPTYIKRIITNDETWVYEYICRKCEIICEVKMSTRMDTVQTVRELEKFRNICRI